MKPTYLVFLNFILFDENSQPGFLLSINNKYLKNKYMNDTI